MAQHGLRSPAMPRIRLPLHPSATTSTMLFEIFRQISVHHACQTGTRKVISHQWITWASALRNDRDTRDDCRWRFSALTNVVLASSHW